MNSHVVLAHGFLGPKTALSELGNYLSSKGHAVSFPVLPPVFDLAEGARAIDEVTREDSIVIAMSLSGLCCRHLKSKPKGIITVCSPHGGTSATEFLEDKKNLWWKAASIAANIYSFAQAKDTQYNSFKKIISEINAAKEEVSSFKCPIVAIAGTETTHRFVFQKLARHITEREGPNDGLVSVASALRVTSAVWVDNLIALGSHLELTNGILLREKLEGFINGFD